MVFFLLFLAVLAAVGYRASTPKERERIQRHLRTVAERSRAAFHDLQQGCESFDAALRARARWVPLTFLLIALHATVFILMVAGPGAFGDTETLVAWGGNFGLRTANGEWWRLLTATFVPWGTLHLLACLAGLAQVGPILERLVGRVTFLAVYFTSGLFASLVSLSERQLEVNVGPSGAIFGLYGLLIASSIWAMFPRSTMTIPMAAWRRLAPGAAVFVLFNTMSGALPIRAELAGLGAGFIWGLALAHGVGARTPPLRRVAASVAVTLAIGAAGAVSLGGITDVGPEIEHVVAVEDRTASTYRTAAEQFRKRRMSAESLAQLIEQSIVPELLEVEGRLKELTGVPPEHRPMVADAEEYVRLRSESWQLRAAGLRQSVALETGAGRESGPSARLRAEARHTSSSTTMGKAEGRERASLEALERIKAVNP